MQGLEHLWQTNFRWKEPYRMKTEKPVKRQWKRSHYTRENGTLEIVEGPSNEKVMLAKIRVKHKTRLKRRCFKTLDSPRGVWRLRSEMLARKFYPVAYSFLIKLIFSLLIQRGCTARHTEFENAFPNARLERPVYVEMPLHVLSTSEHGGRVTGLRRGLYGLKVNVRTWEKLLFNTFKECKLIEMNIALCLFVVSIGIMLCYVDDLILLAADENFLNDLYDKRVRNVWSKDLGH